jgi:hypothetical protein
MICANALDMLNNSGRFGACNTASALTPQAVRSIAMAAGTKARNQYSDKPTRPIRIEGDVAYVPLTKGYEAVIDAADVPLVEGGSWYALVTRRADGGIKAVYAARADYSSSSRKTVFMHRVIAKTPADMKTDHISGDGLDNRRRNLRHATDAQNGRNKRTGSHNTSGTKGVSWDKIRGKWEAQIVVNGQKKFLGYYANIDSAATAYAQASAKLHGEFGRLA